MDERVGYARIVFKPISKRNLLKRDCRDTPPQIIFYVGHGILKTPAIIVHKSLSLDTNYLPDGWLETERFDNATLFEAKGNCFRIFTPTMEKDAYEFLIEQLHMGDKRYFVAKDSLIQSWKIWSPVLKMMSNPKVYSPGFLSAASLRYKVINNNLQFVKKHAPGQSLQSNIFLKKCDTKPCFIPFLGQFAIIGPRSYIIKELSEDLELATLANSDKNFHVALSGGSSPLYVYKYMTQNMRNLFPWETLNIWQVDERCSAEHSNFQPLNETLLKKVAINQTKVHPMLSEFGGRVCSNTAAQIYEQELHGNVCNGGKCSFHFILLGMGADGHTASIFPYNEGVYEKERHVTLVNVTARDVVSPQRMTLTFKAIKNSKHIAVLITGKNKCEILQELSRLKTCGTANVPLDVVEKYPICGIFSRKGSVTWYIEEDALSCME